MRQFDRHASIEPEARVYGVRIVGLAAIFLGGVWRSQAKTAKRPRADLVRASELPLHVLVITVLLAWVAHAHISHGANVKAQFVVLVLAVFGGALCWVWSNTVRFYRAMLRAKLEAPDAETWRSDSFTLNDHRVPLILSVFFAVIALMAIGRIL